MGGSVSWTQIDERGETPSHVHLSLPGFRYGPKTCRKESLLQTEQTQHANLDSVVVEILPRPVPSKFQDALHSTVTFTPQIIISPSPYHQFISEHSRGRPASCCWPSCPPLLLVVETRECLFSQAPPAHVPPSPSRRSGGSALPCQGRSRDQ